MSRSLNFKAVGWAMDVRGVSANAWRLLIMMAGYAHNERFEVWAACSTLAEDAELSVSSVRRALKELMERGLLVHVAARFRDDGARSTNSYALQVGRISIIPGQENVVDLPDGIAISDPPLVNLTRGPSHSSDEGALVTADQCKESIIEGGNEGNPSPIIPKQELMLYEAQPDGIMTESEIVQAFIERWDVLAGKVRRLSKISRFEDKRRASLLARVAEFEPSRHRASVLALIDRVLATIEGSRFLRGEKVDWKVDPTWALKPASFLKLEETGYAQDYGNLDRARPEDRSTVEAGRKALELLRSRRPRPPSDQYST